MKNKDLEKQLHNALVANQPDVWVKIEPRCNQKGIPERQTALATATDCKEGVLSDGRYNNKLAISLFVSFLAVLLACVIIIPIALSINKINFNLGDSFYIDINPSAQVLLDEKGKVEDIKAVNADAVELLRNAEENCYRGMSSEQAIDYVIDLAVESGYIIAGEENNAILITTDLQDEKGNDVLAEKLQKRVGKKAKDCGFNCDVLTEKNDKCYREMADEYGISGGKYKLIMKAKELGAEIEEKDYADIPIRELNDKLKAAEREWIESDKGEFPDEWQGNGNGNGSGNGNGPNYGGEKGPENGSDREGRDFDDDNDDEWRSGVKKDEGRD